MKQLFLALVLVAFSIVAKAQTPVIDTTIKGIAACRINPVKASFQDTANSVFLGAYVVADNLKNSATFYWCLMLPVTDSTGQIIGAGARTSQGNYTMTEVEYLAWCHDEPCDTYPFSVIAKAYGLTFPPVTENSGNKK